MSRDKFAIGQIIMFFIWPFGSFLASLATLDRLLSRFIFVLFAVLYGYTFVFSLDAFGADNGRVVEDFLMISELNFEESIDFFIEEKSTDVFMELSFFFVSRFTDNPNVLYAFYASIYALFFILCISKLFKEHKNKNLSSFLILVLFLLFIRFSAINGVRFWIASFIYIYGIYNLVVENKHNYLLLLLLTPLIHFSYVFGLLVITTYFIIGRNVTYCYTLLFFSLILPDSLLRMGIGKLSIFTDKFNSYASSENLAMAVERRKNSILLMRLAPLLAHNFISFALFIPRLFTRNEVFGDKETRLYHFLIVFLALLGFASLSYELHRRFIEIFIMLVLMFFFLLLNNEDFYFIKPKHIDMLAYGTGLALAPQIIIGLRSGIETLNVELLYKSIFQIHAFDSMSVLEFIDTYIR